MRGKDLLKCMEYIDDKLIEEALNPTIDLHKNNFSTPKWGIVAAGIVVIGVSAATFWSHQNTNTSLVEEQFVEHTDNSVATQPETEINDKDQGDAKRLQERGVMTEMAADVPTYAMEEKIDEQALASKNSVDSELLKENTIEESRSAYIIVSDYYAEKDTPVHNDLVPKKGTVLCYPYLRETINYYAEQEKTSDVIDSKIYAYQIVIDLYGEISTANDTQYEDLYHTEAGNALIEQEYQRLINLGYAVNLSEDFQLTGIFTKAEIDTFQAAPEFGYIFRFGNES